MKELLRAHSKLIKRTQNWSGLTWLGTPIWQSPLDLWIIQETIAEVRPDLVIECGTNRGGSALYYAHLFDLLGAGRVITIDVDHLHQVEHPRITFLHGSSVSPDIVAQVTQAASASRGPVMVMLDSDHSEEHVARECEAYCGLVTPGSFLHVQDGIIDELPVFRKARPGPLGAIRSFLARHPEFEVDAERSTRFLFSHHPMGWLRRAATS